MARTVKHLIFYDADCGLCTSSVQWVLKYDRQEIFAFAPLGGETASQMLSAVPQEVKQADSLILVTDYQTRPEIYIYGKGALRIAWLIGGPWTLFGLLSFLPGWLYNWQYRLVAKYRHVLFPQILCQLTNAHLKNRFLP